MGNVATDNSYVLQYDARFMSFPKTVFIDRSPDKSLKVDVPYNASVFGHELLHQLQHSAGVHVTGRAVGLQLNYSLHISNPYTYDASTMDPDAMLKAVQGGERREPGPNISGLLVSATHWRRRSGLRKNCGIGAGEVFVRQMSQYRRALRLSAILAFALLILGCEQEGNLTMVSLTDAVPEFCFSRYSECKGGALQLAQIDVSQVDENGKPISTVWYIERAAGAGNEPLQRVVYGTVPPGWSQSRPAVPLRPETYYAIMGQWFFALTADGRGRVYNQNEFLDEMRLQK